MTSKRISELAAAATLTGAEVVPVVQGGVTKRATADEIAGLVSIPPGTYADYTEGLLVGRPAATAVPNKTFYLVTDQGGGTLYRSNGTSWVQLAAGVSVGSAFSTFTGVADCVEVTDAVVTVVGSVVKFGSVAAALTSAAAGKSVIINGAGVAGATLRSTIVSVTAGLATLAATAGTAVSGARAYFGTDTSTARIVAILALYNGGGGTLVYPPGKFLDMAKWDMPRSGLSSYPVMGGVRVTGAGDHLDGLYDRDAMGATQIILGYEGAGPAKIDSRGLGAFEIDHLMLIEPSATCTLPFLQVTNTSPKVHDVTFSGYRGKTLTQCDQDAIYGGGSTTSVDYGSNAADAPFQGYGGYIEHNYFTHIRCGIYGRSAFNGMPCGDNTFSRTCGSNLTLGTMLDSPLCSEGHAPDDTNGGNDFTGNLLELDGYPCGVHLKNTRANDLAGVKFYDPGAGITERYIYFDTGAVENWWLVMQYSGGITAVVEHPSVRRKNRGVDPTDQPGAHSLLSRLVVTEGLTSAGDLIVTNVSEATLWGVSSADGTITSFGPSSGNDVGIFRSWLNGGLTLRANGTATIEIDTGPGGAFLDLKAYAQRLYDHAGHVTYRATGVGSPEGAFTAPVGSTYHRTDGGAGTSFYVKETGAGNTGWVGK